MSTRRLAYFGLLSAGGLTALTALTALGVLTAAPAAAHVTVQPGEATKGGYAKLAFRVPNESSTAGTIKLEVSFPQDTPLASVRTKPMAGWTASVRKEPLATPVTTGNRQLTEAVRTVTWTAEPGVRIGPGEFTEFELSTGPLPDADRMLFPATQTYDDGKVVTWNAPPAVNGAAEPEHPAPVLTLLAGGSAHAHSTVVEQTATADHAGSTDQTARAIGVVGLAVGVLGLAAAGGGLLANRRGARAGGDE
jgi:uncharacterized protein YcnI